MKWRIFFLLLIFPFIGICQSPADHVPDENISSLSKNDSSRKIYVSSIVITGNKKTRDYIIRREMLFKEGDSIVAGNLFELMEESRKLIYNTSLFTSVTVEPSSLVTNNQISIAVHVKEKWYLYPTPQFQIIDRNFNEWIKVYNADLNRVIYGVKFAHYNISGRRDQLRIYALNGYSRNISLTYSAPYSNPSLTEGFAIGVGYTENREIAYKTTKYNTLLQFNTGNFVRRAINAGGSYIVRKGYYKRHSFGIAYTYSAVADSVLLPKYNSNYFNSGNHVQHIPDFSYSYSFIKTDNVVYPLEGKIYGISFTKRGFGISGGINALFVDGQYNKYIDHGKNWYSSISVIGKVHLPFKLAYINQRAFGFQDYNLRGLEYYVIDGVASGMVRYTFKKKIIDFKIKNPIKKFRVIPEIPFKIFAKTYADAGYSYIQQEYRSMLNNKLLYTGGFGIDILTLYDINLRLEYSFNQLNQNGLFLHSRGGF